MLISSQAICFRVAGGVIYDESADDRLALCSSYFCGNVAERAISSASDPSCFERFIYLILPGHGQDSAMGFQSKVTSDQYILR